MAYYNEATQTADVMERTFASVARFFDAAAESRAKGRIYRVTLKELNTLSERELADLGMHRSELKRIAWRAAYNTDPR